MTAVRDDGSASAAVERIVAAARMPGRAAREDLRRELLAHFEDAGEAGNDRALDRFDEDAVAHLFRGVYRRDYAIAYALKVGASMAISMLVAVAIEALVNVRFAASSWQLAPGFARSTPLAIVVAAAIVAVREAIRTPFSRVRAAAALGACAAAAALSTAADYGSARLWITSAALVGIAAILSRLEWRASRVLFVLAAFAATEYAVHVPLPIAFGPSRALAAGAVLATVWSTTVLVAARIDSAFSNWFGAV